MNTLPLNKISNTPYYDLASINDLDGQHTARNMSSLPPQNQRKNIIVILYYNFKSYLEKLEEEVQYEKEKLFPLVRVWFLVSLIANIFIHKFSGFIAATIFDLVILYLGLQGLWNKKQKSLYAFVALFLVCFVLQFFGAAGGLMRKNYGVLSFCFDVGLSLYEAVVLYVIIKIEWLMRKVHAKNSLTPRSSIYEKPMIDDFELVSRKNSTTTSD